MYLFETVLSRGLPDCGLAEQTVFVEYFAEQPLCVAAHVIYGQGGELLEERVEVGPEYIALPSLHTFGLRLRRYHDRFLERQLVQLVFVNF
jgi:hypothetical protein